MKIVQFYINDGTVLEFTDWKSWKIMWKRVRQFYKRADVVKVVEREV